MLDMSDGVAMLPCATRSAVVEARLVTSARQASARDASTTPKNSVIITGSSSANSTAASPSLALRKRDSSARISSPPRH